MMIGCCLGYAIRASVFCDYYLLIRLAGSLVTSFCPKYQMATSDPTGHCTHHHPSKPELFQHPPSLTVLPSRSALSRHWEPWRIAMSCRSKLSRARITLSQYYLLIIFHSRSFPLCLHLRFLDLIYCSILSLQARCDRTYRF